MSYFLNVFGKASNIFEYEPIFQVGKTKLIQFKSISFCLDVFSLYSITFLAT